MGIEALFEPAALQHLELRSRFVLSPMSYYKNPEAKPTAEFAAYHRRRARAPLGLTITGATAVNRPAANNHPALAGISEHTLDAWRHVVEEVHAENCPVALQLWHAGALFNVAPGWKPGPMESPSGLVEAGQLVGSPMSDAQVASCIEAFAHAASLACDIGFDAIEIHAAHGFLIDQFFWDSTNLRKDRWGGPSLAARSEFALEVVRAVRHAIGAERPLLMRVSQWKEQDYSAKLADSPGQIEAWLGPFADAGVDVFDCSQRRFWEPEFAGSDLNFAGWVKKLLSVPTITVGSVGLSNDVMSFFHGETAERRPLDELVRRFERGDFDFVAVGRSLLAEPNWLRDVRSGHDLDEPPIRVQDLDLGI